MNRRGFLGALAVVMAAPRTLANVLKKEPSACIMEPPFKVRSVSASRAHMVAQLDALINPRYMQHADGTLHALFEPNPILADMTWKDV